MAARFNNPGPAVQQPWPAPVPGGGYPPMHMGGAAPYPPQAGAWPQPVPVARPPYPPASMPHPHNPALLSQPQLALISQPSSTPIPPSTTTTTTTTTTSSTLIQLPNNTDTLEQKKKERDKREKERKEREMRKQRESEAMKQRENQKQLAIVAPKEQQRQSNLLKAPSDFLCRMQFRNNLPDIPFDPKLLVLPQDQHRYTKCIIGSTLENSYKHSLFTEVDLGVPINLIDTNLYKVQPGVKMSIDPEDQALLDATVASAPRKGTGVPHYEKPKVRPSVTWLIKTKYLCNEEDLPQFKAKGVESAPSVYKIKKAGGIPDQELSSLEAQIRAVEDTFEAAKRDPVHPTNPAARAVEILPIFPDFNLWPNLYTEVVFDSDPITSLPHDRTVNMDEQDKHFLLSNSIVRSCSIKGQQLVAFMAPTEATTARKRSREELTEEDDEFEQICAFHYDVAKDSDLKDNYFFVFTPEAVYFNELSTRVKLRKVQSKEEKTMLLGIPKPSSVHVACEDISDDTKVERDEKFTQLLQPASVEETD